MFLLYLFYLLILYMVCGFNLFLYYSFVHGRLPYTMLKPDPVLRNLLLSLPVRKVVRSLFFLWIAICDHLEPRGSIVTIFWSCIQIFTNADKNHAARVLNRLGLEDCFEGIICVETLNPTKNDNSSVDGAKFISNTGILDISNYSARPDSELELPSCPVVCKPFENAFERVFEIANINPQKTVN